MSHSFKSTLLSVFLWGGGQFIVCKQKIKGAVLFLFQIIFVAIEMATGYWLEFFTGQIAHFSIRLHGGFFTRGIWGIITLGDVAGAKNGDHSTMLLINGIITIMVLGVFCGIYVLNLRDANKSAKLIDKSGAYQSEKESFKKLATAAFAYIVLAPIALLFLFIVVMPILFSALTAFLNYNRDHLPPGNLIDWVGMDNFKKLFNVPIWSKTFFSVLGWTVVWAVTATVTTYALGMGQALILNSKYVRCKKMFQTILILPWAMPQMISLMVFKNLLNGQFGPINQFLMDMGWINERIPFLTDPTIAKITVILVNLWLGFPMFMIMLLGVFANLDKSLYEAASIDGANKIQSFGKITMPLVFRATAPLLVMNLAGNFNGFGAIYFLTEGGPVNPNYQFAGDTDILISWIYKLTLNQQMYNMAAVMSILIFVFVGAFSFWNFKRTTSFKEA